MENTLFYRFDWIEFAKLDYDGDYVRPLLPNPVVRLHEFILLKETPKGYWICPAGMPFFKTWVSKTSRKKYAYLSKEDARTNFVARTNRRIKILSHQVDCCKIALELVKNSFK